MNAARHPAYLVIVKFKSKLANEELERRYRERLPRFREVPGLLQKYYIHDPQTDEWGGVYLWDSRESMEKYLDSDLRRTIPDTYDFAAPPRIEAVEVVEVLRP